VLHVIKWAARLVAGGVSVVLAILSTAIFREMATSVGAPPWAIPAAIGLHLAGGLLAFATFFLWRLTRVVGSARRDSEQVTRRGRRTVAVVLSGLGLVGVLVGLLAALGLVGAPFAEPGTVGLILFLVIASLASGMTGIGVWRDTTWARRSAVLSGFLFFGNVPIGTALALYLWWFARTTVARE